MTGRWAGDAIVVAAGRSTRMGGVDKLTADLAGRPVLAWSLGALAAVPEIERLVVVRPTGRGTAEEAAMSARKVVAVVDGGERRQDSVAAGIRALLAMEPHAPSDGRVLLVHDAARPLVERDLIDRVAGAAVDHGAAIPVIPVADTLQRVAADGVIHGTLDRDGVAAAQTPQAVRWEVVRDAMARRPLDGDDLYTDEAGWLATAGVGVRAVPGDPDNLKVTRPDDLDRASRIVAGRAATRTGIGHDAHPFGPGSPLRLGGIAITAAPALQGHSDGDAALHALADALLGAAAAGDLGSLHPADARTPRGVASIDLLRDVVARLAASGWRPRAVDLTITAARPRLAAHLPAMRDAMATLLGLAPDDVSVKASTGNLSGDAGAGRVVEVAAIATITRLAGTGR